MAHRSEDIRNVALFGHGDSGKTGLVDALAVLTKVAQRHGNSADGSSISNIEPEEKEKKHTLTPHVFHFPFEKGHLNIIDTPGHADFCSGPIAALNAVETGVLCVNAAAGLTFHARKLWGEAGKASVARCILITHIDIDTADFDRVLAQLQAAFGDAVVPMTYPDKSGHGIATIYDVLKGEGPRAAEFKGKIEEHVAEADDEVLEHYLSNGTLSAADLESHFCAAITKGKLVPLFVACPPKMLGVAALSNYLVRYAPSPLTFGGRGAAKVDSESFDQIVAPDPNGPFAARVFKIEIDPHVGRVSFLRCMRGHLKAEEGFLHVRAGKHQKIGSLSEIQGKDKKPIDMVVAGDIFAITKVEDLALWDTVTADATPLRFPAPAYPLPTFSLAVTPKARGDEAKIGQGLEKLHTEDPTFHVQRDPNTGELVVSGLSPVHLEIQLHRLQRRYGVGTDHHLPTIPYKETITGRAEGHHRHKKQSGGRGQFGEVYLRIAPRERGAGFEFVDGVVGGSIPRQFIPEVEKGIHKFLHKGGLAGFPVIDVQAEVYDGKFHDVDSDQISFQIAGERAFADAVAKAKPVLMEPLMDVDIFVPQRFTGDVAGSLSSIRGRMQGMDEDHGVTVIKAQVPLKELQDYSTQLRSITAGEGSFTMKYSHHELVPGNIQADIVAKYRKAQEAAQANHH